MRVRTGLRAGWLLSSPKVIDAMNYGYAGVDTIKVAVDVESLRPDLFQHQIVKEDRVGSSSVRWIHNTDHIRTTYRPNAGVVSVEVSLPKLASGQNASVLTPSEHDQTLATLSEYVSQFSKRPLASWRVQRVDYAITWELGDLLDAYLAAVKECALTGAYERVLYPRGVMWKSRTRSVMFYDKGEEMGDKALRLLRFEVSSRGAIIDHVAGAWLGVDRTCGDLVTPWAADAMIVRFLVMLGLDRPVLANDELSRFRAAFGSRWPQARSYRDVIVEAGGAARAAAWGVPRSTYYKYKAELERAGLMNIAKEALPALLVHRFEKILSPQPNAY